MQPFSTHYLSELIKRKNEKISEDIEELTDDQIISNELELLANNIYEKYKYFPINIENELTEKRELHQVLQYGNISGVSLTSTFPFTGEVVLLKSRASTYCSMGLPNIELYDNYFTITVQESLEVMGKIENKNRLFDEIKRNVDLIKKFIQYGNNDVNIFNNSIKETSLSLLKKRKEKIEQYQNISQILEIPLEIGNKDIINEIKIERKIIPIINKISGANEYAISNENYESILSIIKHVGSSFEGTPKTYSVHGEEELRDIILSHLNCVFKGNAKGESFRKKRKN